MSFYPPQSDQQQAEALLACFAQGPDLPLPELLTPADVVAAFHDAGVSCSGSATAIFTPQLTLWAFLGQLLSKDPSCRNAVLRVVVLCVALSRPGPSSDTAAYCRARARLPVATLQRLAKLLAQRLADNVPAAWRWLDRPVKMVDGSTSSIPDSSANRAAFPTKPKKRLVSYPLIRWVCLICLASAGVLDFAYGPYQGKRTGELSLFRQLEHHLVRGDVLLADRFYCTWFTFALAQQKGVDVVARLHASRQQDFRVGIRNGRHERLMFWRRPPRPDWLAEATYAQLPAELEVRELLVHVAQRGFRTQRLIVATTLLDREVYSYSAVAQLYQSRWQVELDIRSLKTQLGLKHLRCQSPEMLAREIWGNILAYNLVRKTCCQAALLQGVRGRAISFTAAKQALNAGLGQQAQLDRAGRQQLSQVLLKRLGQERVGNRPGRVEPRATKTSPSPYPRLRQARGQRRNRPRVGPQRGQQRR